MNNLHIAIACDLGDLVAWAVDHARPETFAWLDNLNPDQYPWIVAIPAELDEDVANLLDDWIDVLSAHPEEDTPFLTHIVAEDTAPLL